MKVKVMNYGLSKCRKFMFHICYGFDSNIIIIIIIIIIIKSTLSQNTSLIYTLYKLFQGDKQEN